MEFREYLKNNLVFLDGAMGTQLQEAGLAAGELPEEWNLSHAERITQIHRAYLNAGSDVVYTNTFGANSLKFGARTGEIVAAAVSCAKKAVAGQKNKFIALDVGPTGKMIKPLGPLGFEEAVQIFKTTIAAGVQAGVDLIAIETMNDCYEMKAAVLAAKETCSLPVLATLVFGEDEKTMTGASPEAAVALLEGLGVDALGVNCSLSPNKVAPVVARMLAVASVPVVIKPNAGLPEEKEGKACYSLSPKQFAEEMQTLIKAGARVAGGCCGTSPEYIKQLKEACEKISPALILSKNLTVISSYTHAVTFGQTPVLIGERINPTGKKRLKEALKEGDIASVLNEAVRQAEAGAHALDVNVGLPELNEPALLTRCVEEIQAVTDLPLQIDTSSPEAMEQALRIYNGKPLINSVNGTKESMAAIFPLAKKYGGAVICLTLNEKGIPATSEGRVAIAKEIIAEAKKYGIEKNQLIFDTLATAVSADSASATLSLEALKTIKEELGCNTSLGISNISFGLPKRDFITAGYFTLALGAGLSAAIYNPYSEEINKAYKTYMALAGKDRGCESYIAFASDRSCENSAPSQETSLKYCVVKGLKEEAAACATQLTKTTDAMQIINGEIIPALDEVGKGFENKTVFLPQLLMSAEAASAAFESVRQAMCAFQIARRVKIVLATVKGDIHDIGKNIVATLLRNYGFTVYDLGKDVPPQTVVEAAKEHGAHIVGLSALMTTTVAAMKETVALLKAQCPAVKICVGGAVLNEEYATLIGADKYCKDAMDTVRYAEEIEGK